MVQRAPQPVVAVAKDSRYQPPIVRDRVRTEQRGNCKGRLCMPDRDSTIKSSLEALKGGKMSYTIDLDFK